MTDCLHPTLLPRNLPFFSPVSSQAPVFSATPFYHSSLAITPSPVHFSAQIIVKYRASPLVRHFTVSGGSDPHYLHPLAWASAFASSGSVTLWMALTNTRSIANKSFILNDFSLQKAWILFLTWQMSLGNTPLTEMCPMDCTFISIPRTSGRG